MSLYQKEKRRRRNLLEMCQKEQGKKTRKWNIKRTMRLCKKKEPRQSDIEKDVSDKNNDKQPQSPEAQKDLTKPATITMAKKKGLAVICVHGNFDQHKTNQNLKSIETASDDLNMMRNAWKSCGFEVLEYTDQKNEFYDKILLDDTHEKYLYRMFTPPQIVIIVIAIVTAIPLVSLSKSSHRHGGNLLNFLLVGFYNVVFLVLTNFRYYLKIKDTSLTGTTLNDNWYVLPMTCFVINFGILVSSTSIDKVSKKIWYGIYVLVSIFFLITVYLEIVRCKCYTMRQVEYGYAPEEVSTHLTWTRQVIRMISCHGNVEGMAVCFLLEYLLMYMPSSVIVYRKIFREYSFKEWWTLPQKTKCEECQFHISLCNHFLLGFLACIWFIMPFRLVFSDKFPNICEAEGGNDIAMASVAAFFVVMWIYLVKFYFFYKNPDETFCVEFDDEVTKTTI